MIKMTKGEMSMHALEACFALERLSIFLPALPRFDRKKAQSLFRNASGHIDLILGRRTDDADRIEIGCHGKLRDGRRCSALAPVHCGFCLRHCKDKRHQNEAHRVPDRVPDKRKT